MKEKLKVLKEITSLLKKSNFKSDKYKRNIKKQCEEYGLNYELVEKQTDTTDLMEGIYIKVENEEEVIDRFKYVRSSFLNTILDSETHWVKKTNHS